MHLIHPSRASSSRLQLPGAGSERPPGSGARDGARTRPRPIGLWPGLALLGAAALLGGCAALVVGGAVTGAAAIHDRRDYTDMLDDQEIEIRAMAALAGDKSLSAHSRIAATSYNHKVLLTGQADTDELKAQAAETVSRLPKVERVIDEIGVGPSISLMQESKDVLLTSRAKLALTKVSLPGFDATRVKVVTEDSVVYLMGLLSSEEADAVVEQVRWVPDVQRVVRLFEVGEPGYAN
jgi:osmotically-inducible protein OsmY